MKKNVSLLLLCLLFVSMAYSQKDTSGNNPEAPVNIIKVKVFPNPATNVVNVLGLQNCNKAEFTISDLYGNVGFGQWYLYPPNTFRGTIGRHQIRQTIVLDILIEYEIISHCKQGTVHNG